ncbi:MAG TPA: biotin/lipoyl-binding protein [Bacteroidetes bacterium]|nr:biotin/lipoyl-binding protein [Bacteroidota bacterium]HEX04192.1 biotin/lipoyl-binding protein [Bacteroidota bacterium]
MKTQPDHNSYLVEVNGNQYRVIFLDNGNVLFDDHEYSLDMKRNNIPNQYSLLIDNESLFLSFMPDAEPNRYRVSSDGYFFETEVLSSREALLREHLVAAGVGKKDGKIKASMPGMIRQLLVKLGDRVEADQGILIMEAMKMENEIRSPISGVVTNFGVEEGDAVEKGAFLFEIEAS